MIYINIIKIGHAYSGEIWKDQGLKSRIYKKNLLKKQNKMFEKLTF